MESIAPDTRRNHIPGAMLALALLLAAVSCVSCGPRVIEGRPPFIGISGMELLDGALRVDFRISNQNGVPMTIEAIDLGVTANDVRLIGEYRELALLIDANSAEEILVRGVADQPVLDLLESLEAQDINSLRFDLQGRVRTLEDGYLRFEQKGHLYPVPGKPGFFRSAVTQAERLQREEKL